MFSKHIGCVTPKSKPGLLGGWHANSGSYKARENDVFDQRLTTDKRPATYHGNQGKQHILGLHHVSTRLAKTGSELCTGITYNP